MTLALLYWILMLLWLILGSYLGYAGGYRILGPNVMLFVLLLLLGWKAFGSPIKGG